MSSKLDRRSFLAGAASLGGAAVLGGCGSGSSGGGSSAASRPPIGQEPGNLSIYEWQGYEAAGTKAQKAYGMTVPGKSYVDKYGADSLTYTAFPSDDTAVNKVAAGTQFDLMHPCISYVKDWTNAGLIQPFDTSLFKNWSQLDPNVTKAGVVDGQQYWIPWDSGYSSILYRKDKVDPADATGWELFWNPKYKGKISMWDGGSTPVEIAGLLNGVSDPYNMSDSELEAAKQKLIEQKSLNAFYWKLEYDDMQPAFSCQLQLDSIHFRFRIRTRFAHDDSALFGHRACIDQVHGFFRTRLHYAGHRSIANEIRLPRAKFAFILDFDRRKIRRK